MLQAAVFAVVLCATLTPYPALDMFSWLQSWLDLRRDGDWAAYLWAPHNEHHLLFTRALVALDMACCGGRGVALIVAATACVALAAGLAYRAARHALAPHASPALAWLAPMLVLGTAAAVDASTPINTVYPLAVAAVLGIVLLYGPPKSPTWRPVLAFCAAPLAACCGAWGFCVWPALAWLAWARPARQRWLATITAAALAYATLYIATLPNFRFGPPAAGLAGSLLRGALILPWLAGLPLSRAPVLAPAGATLGGALIAAGFLALIWPPHAQSSRRVAQALIVAGLAGAILVAAGRAAVEAPDQLPVRYTILLLPLHLGLLLTAFGVLRDHPARARTILPAGAGLAIALLIMNGAAVAPAIRIATARRAVLQRFYGGARDPAMTATVFPDLATADRILAAVARASVR
jgi:hypothetical protein